MRNSLSVAGAACMVAIWVFAVIEGSITSWLVSNYGHHHTYPSNNVRVRLQFLVFTSWWTVLFTTLFFFTFIFHGMGYFASIAAHSLWSFITWTLWLAGAASITAALGGGINCSRRAVIYCHQLVAAEAFAWIVWILLTMWLVWVLVRLEQVRRSTSGGVGQAMDEV